MHHHRHTLAALTAASTLMAVNATAEIEYELGTGYSTEYLFRGLNLGQDLVETSATVKTSYQGIDLKAVAWYASYDVSAEGIVPGAREYDIDELDLTAEASKDLGFATASLGYVYYNNEDALGLIDDAQELYVSVSRDLGFASGYATYFLDLETDNDGYSEVGLSRAFEIAESLNLNLGSNLGFLVEQGQATAWTTRASIDWAFAEHAKLSPFVALAVSLTDDADTVYSSTENELVAGTLLSVGF
jgi:hypothetical protein